jgi:hypothetical protein
VTFQANIFVRLFGKMKNQARWLCPATTVKVDELVLFGHFESQKETCTEFKY